MHLLDNPVLQRELVVNLRTTRAFLLLLSYQVLLAAVVYFAWPRETRLDANADEAQGLVNMFFLGQYVLASLMSPSFAAGTITGEKERRTYEMLLASPLRPSAITLGKLLSSLTPLALLIVASLPIVMLCLPLGGVSPLEVLAAYLGLMLSVVTFGMISVACSSYFQRTAAALVTSYLLILPLAFLGILIWISLELQGVERLLLTATVLPAIAAVICITLFLNTNARLLHPPDVGSEGKDVVDLEQEAQTAVGLVIQRDHFPDRLFAPPKREDLMEDGANPVYDKEIHSEIFSQGTLMLRLVIMISMLLAIPIMAFCLFINPQFVAWYISYVVLFNMLVGPVFSAGTVTGERERQTLDLLLTTTITPRQILWGKLIAGLRVSSVLTLFLVWPLLLACVMVSEYWSNLVSVVAHLLIVLITCGTTATLALFFSVVFQKTSTSLLTTYLVMIFLFWAPLAMTLFTKTLAPNRAAVQSQEDPAAVPRSPVAEHIHLTGVTSPFAAAFSVPFTVEASRGPGRRPTPREGLFPTGWHMCTAYVAWSLGLIITLLAGMIWLFRTRWRVSQ